MNDEWITFEEEHASLLRIIQKGLKRENFRGLYIMLYRLKKEKKKQISFFKDLAKFKCLGVFTIALKPIWQCDAIRRLKRLKLISKLIKLFQSSQAGI